MLREAAGRRGLTFGIKLSNTLPVHNHRAILPGDEIYMSGRALYPLAVHLFHTLACDFPDGLNIPFRAVRMRSMWAPFCLRRPAGYRGLGSAQARRLCPPCLQYLERPRSLMHEREPQASMRLARNEQIRQPRLVQRRTRSRIRAIKDTVLRIDLPKVDSGLALFDCITAPCVEPCAVRQDVPEYARLRMSRGRV